MLQKQFACFDSFLFDRSFSFLVRIHHGTVSPRLSCVMKEKAEFQIFKLIGERPSNWPSSSQPRKRATRARDEFAMHKGFIAPPPGVRMKTQRLSEHLEERFAELSAKIQD